MRRYEFLKRVMRCAGLNLGLALYKDKKKQEFSVLSLPKVVELLYYAMLFNLLLPRTLCRQAVNEEVWC